MISFDEAVRLVGDAAVPLGAEMVPLAQAHGRVLAAPVIARVSSPPQNVSAMDGYAARTEDLAVLPADLTIIGESLPGIGYAGVVRRGSTVRIFTGAPVPPGADRIVLQEHVERQSDLARILAIEPASFVRNAGSDFVAGDVLVEAGTPLTPRTLVAAAAADVAQVEVHRRPRLRLLATGDELAAPGTACEQPGAIPDSVSLGVMALAQTWGAEVLSGQRLPDRLEMMQRAAQAALSDSDVLVVTGGASVGERDFARAMFGEALQLVFSKARIKPGKPVWLGRVGSSLILGLPGNPTSALVTARLLLAPLLAGLNGRDPSEALRWRRMPLGEALGSTGDRETFSRGFTRDGAAFLLPNQDSGAQRTLAASELLVRRAQGATGYAAGGAIDVLDFD